MIHTTPALRERAYGIYENKLRSSFLREKKILEDINAHVPFGESFADVKHRVLSFLHRLQGKNILIVTHSNCMKAILMRLRALSFAQVQKLNITHNTVLVVQKKELFGNKKHLMY